MVIQMYLHAKILRVHSKRRFDARRVHSCPRRTAPPSQRDSSVLGLKKYERSYSLSKYLCHGGGGKSVTASAPARVSRRQTKGSPTPTCLTQRTDWGSHSPRDAVCWTSVTSNIYLRPHKTRMSLPCCFSWISALVVFTEPFDRVVTTVMDLAPESIDKS